MQTALRDWAARSGWRSYLSESTAPLYSLVLFIPCLMFYEFAWRRYGGDIVRNGADVWLDRLLQDAGVVSGRWLPLVTLCGLLAWHYLSRRPWRLKGRVVAGMMIESSLYAVVLFLLASAAWSMLHRAEGALGHPVAATGDPVSPSHIRWMFYCGAGVYEEVLFRAVLLPLLLTVLIRVARPRAAMLLAVAFTSLLFALVHYQPVNPYGELFDWYSFWFRSAAGAAFSLVFLSRGIGIAALTHVGYDILTIY